MMAAPKLKKTWQDSWTKLRAYLFFLKYEDQRHKYIQDNLNKLSEHYPEFLQTIQSEAAQETCSLSFESSWLCHKSKNKCF